MLKRTIATGACLLAAMLFAVSAQVSAKPLAGSALSDMPLTQAPADARIVQVSHDFGFGFRFGDHGWRGRYWDRGYGYGWRHRGPSFSLAIPVVPRTYADAGSCPYWSQRCADSWGYDNSDYRGCMRYYGC